MNLSFSKTIGTTLIVGDPYYFQEETTYKVFDGEKIAGELFRTKKECLFSAGDKKISLVTRRRFMLLPKVALIDQLSGAKVGQFVQPYALSSKYDKLIIGEVDYTFKILQPDIKFSLFKKETHGHWKFGLFNECETIIYAFRLKYPRIAFGVSSNDIPFEGAIVFRSGNMLALLAGFCFIEMALEKDGD